MALARRNSSPPILVGLVVAAGVVVGARAVQLATHDLAQSGAAASTQAKLSPSVRNEVQPIDELADRLTSPSPRAAKSALADTAGPPAEVRRLPPDPELRAIISAACPHALELFDREGLQEPPPQAESTPRAHPHPVRVAMRPTPAPVRPLRVAQRTGEWLVSPDAWFVPEDQTADADTADKDAENAAITAEPAGSPPAQPAADPSQTAPQVRPLPTPVGPALDQPASPTSVAPAPAAPPTPGTTPRPAPEDDHGVAPDPVEPALAAPSPPTPEQPSVDASKPPAAEPVDHQPWTPAEVEGPELGFEGEPSSPSDTSAPAPAPQAPAAPTVRTTPPQPLFTAPDAQPPARESQPRYERPETRQATPNVQPTQEPAAAPRPIETRRPITPEPIFPAPATQPAAAPAIDPHAGGAPHSVPSQDGKASSDSNLSSIQAHRDLFAKNCYPSAQQCGECHKKLYDEWRVSSHAYAFVSPMFQKFEQKITDLSQGTVGYFCYRCHSPVATTLGENRATPLWEMPEVAREGVTCIACHRINERYTKANGERRIVPGDIYSPVYGGIGGEGVAKVIAKPEHYKVKTSPDQKGAGQPIHLEGRYFDQLTKAEFCTSCHQVAVHPGIKLEVVWEQYRQSPACKKGVTCQDCHMGLKPGEASGYEICSIAEVGGKSVNKQRKHANHMFYGPNYSISHPGVFPQNKDAQRWDIQEWLKFNWRSGWGTDEFEDALDEGKLVAKFPKEWEEADDRFDAREVIDDNLKALEKKNEVRREIMSEHMRVDGPYFKHRPARGQNLRLYYDVTNLNEGHNVLTASLGAQPQLWANVVLIGPDGCRLWESGYTDSDGDLCDIHSRDVQLGRAPFDHQLFNLQTMFLITGAVGTDREMPLPVNVDIDQLPFLRPGAIPITTTNHPPFIRMESRSIAPLGTKRVHYKVPKDLIRAPGRYRLSFRLRNRIEPIWFMRFCDATDEMVRMMNEGILNMHERSVEFWVE